MKWYLLVVLISVSLMTNNVELLFVCSLAICVSTVKKCLFKSFMYLKNYIICIFIIEQYAFNILFEMYVVVIFCRSQMVDSGK